MKNCFYSVASFSWNFWNFRNLPFFSDKQENENWQRRHEHKVGQLIKTVNNLIGSMNNINASLHRTRSSKLPLLVTNSMSPTSMRRPQIQRRRSSTEAIYWWEAGRKRGISKIRWPAGSYNFAKCSTKWKNWIFIKRNSK